MERNLVDTNKIADFEDDECDQTHHPKHNSDKRIEQQKQKQD